MLILLACAPISEKSDGGDGSEPDSGDGAETDGGDGSETDGGDGVEADAGSPDAGSSDAGLTDLCTSCGSCEQKVKITSALHQTGPIDYPDIPPAGGDHAGCWTKFGVHQNEVPDELWVHNLEHGGVVFLHHCTDGCAAEVSELEGLAKGRPFAVVLPYAALTTRFAVIAWGRRLLTDCLDTEAFIRFYDQNANQAIESSSANPGC